MYQNEETNKARDIDWGCVLGFLVGGLQMCRTLPELVMTTVSEELDIDDERIGRLCCCGEIF